MDVEQMHAAASEEYKNNYSTGEYCHEQSFLWGFQEGVELAEANSGKELLYVAQKTAERTKKELKIKARQWLENNKDSYIIDIEGETIVDDAIIEDLLKAMEE
jgi:hypothetical protein